MAELDLCAYYYSFEPTGDEAIDAILAAVAAAGKAAHHTDMWTERVDYEYRGQAPGTPVEWIQRAANAAAKARQEAPAPELCPECNQEGRHKLSCGRAGR